MRVKSTGIVYRNRKPNLRAVHAWHPSVALNEENELAVAYDLGQGPESLDYRTYISFSRDNGAAWSAPVRLFKDSGTGRSTHTVRISGLSGGRQAAFGGLLYRDDPEEGLVNPETFGYTDMDLIYLTSDDGGHSWEGPHVIDTPLTGPSFEVCHSIIELQDGRWLAPTSTWKGWNGEAPNGMKAVALVSSDKGKTWPEYIDVMDDYTHGLIHFEQGMTQLPDGSLLAAAWVFDERSGRSLPNHFSISRDGRSFSPPRPFGLNGETAKLLCLRDGRVLCLYRRIDKPGLWAETARIDGDEWVKLDETPLWQGISSHMSGERSHSEELSGLKFGFPSMIQLSDKEVFAVFWCLEECIHNIRWLRIEV